jgi:hypothetical protein
MKTERVDTDLKMLVAETEAKFKSLEDLDRRAREKFSAWRETQDRELFDQRNAALEEARQVFLHTGDLIQRAGRALEAASFWSGHDFPARFDEILVLLPPPEEFDGARSAFPFLRGLRALLLSALNAAQPMALAATPPAEALDNAPQASSAPKDLILEAAPVRELTPAQLSRRLGLSEETLARWRGQAKGPHHLKIGRRVLYPLEAVEGWLKAQEGDNGHSEKTREVALPLPARRSGLPGKHRFGRHATKQEKSAAGSGGEAPGDPGAGPASKRETIH